MSSFEGLVRGMQSGGRVGRISGLISRWGLDMGVAPDRLLREGIEARQAGKLVDQADWDMWFEAADDINRVRDGDLASGGVSGYGDRIDEDYVRHLRGIGDRLQAAALIGRVRPGVDLFRGMEFEAEGPMQAAMPHGRVVRLPGLTSYTPHQPLAEHFAGADRDGQHVSAMLRLQSGGGLRGVEFPRGDEDYAETVLPRGSSLVHRWRRAPLEGVHEWDVYARDPRSQFVDRDVDRYSDGGRVRGLGRAARRAFERVSPEEVEQLPRVGPVAPLEVQGEDIRARRRAAEEWIEQNLVGQSIRNEALGDPPVDIPRSFAGKFGSHAGDNMIRGLQGLPEVLREGVALRPPTAPDDPRSSTALFHNLMARLALEGGSERAYRAMVRDEIDGRRLLDDFGLLGGGPPASGAGPGQRGLGRADPAMEGRGGPAAPSAEGLPRVNIDDPEAEGFSEGGRIGRILAGLRAFHGSPHRFDRFDISKIGTGEGHQAYGHGLYFAEDEGVARNYRRQLSQPGPEDGVLVDDVPIGELRGLRPGDDVWDRAVGETFSSGETARRLSRPGEDISEVARAIMQQRVRDLVDSAERPLRQAERFGRFPGSDADREWALRDVEFSRRLAREVEGLAGRRIGYREPGAMYEVRLDADRDRMLNWDAPLREQPDAVRALAADRLRRDPFIGQAVQGEMLPASMVYNRLGRSYGASVQGNGYAASSALREAGVPGIRYLDGNSRGAGIGTSNFVMFDDEPIEIIRRYAQGGMVPGGGAAEGLIRQAAAPSGNLPGAADEVATAQHAAARGLGQAAQMWRVAEAALGGGQAF